MGLLDISLGALADVVRSPRNHLVAAFHQTANPYTETWEEEVLKLPALIQHYHAFMLPLYLRSVDSLAGKECGGTSGGLEEIVNCSGSPYFVAGRTLTGATKDASGNYTFQHFAIALALKPFPNDPLLIWDPIKLVLGGQDDTKRGAYYRWPVRTWANIKSVHYGGLNGLAAYYLPGTYLRSKKGGAIPNSFKWI